MTHPAILRAGALVCAAAGALILSGASRADPRSHEGREEVLIASYRCGAGASEAFLSVTFNATGDVFSDETDLFRSVSVASTPGETCEAHSLALLESISPGPCKLGPVEITVDESGQSRSFQFVCRAQRPTIIRIVADVTAAFLTSSP